MKQSKKRFLQFFGTMVLTLNLFSCYQGEQVYQEMKGQAQSTIDQTAAGNVDSEELLRLIQVKSDAVSTGVTAVSDGNTLKEELLSLREEAQSTVTIQKIDEALQSLEVQLLKLESQTNLKAAVDSVLKASQTLASQVQNTAIKLDSIAQVEKSLAQLKTFLSEISYELENLTQVLSSAEKDPAFASQVELLKKMISQLTSSGQSLQELLTQALEKQKEFKGKEQILAELDVQFAAITEEIGKVLAKASNHYDSEKINLIKSLINSLSAISDSASLASVKKTLGELETYLVQTIQNLQKSKAEVQALLSRVKALVQEASLSDYPKLAELQAYLGSLEQVNLDTDIEILLKLRKEIQNTYVAMAEKEKLIRESQLKAELNSELNALKNQFSQFVEGATSQIAQAEKAIQEYLFVQQELTENRFSATLLQQLKSLSGSLNTATLESLLLQLSSLEQQSLYLKQKNSGTLGTIDQFYSEVALSLDRLQQAFQGIQSMGASYAETLSFLESGIREVGNDEYPVSEQEVYVQQGENLKISEALLQNLLRLGKFRNGEIFFYRLERFEEDKEIKVSKKVRQKNGTLQNMTEIRKIKVKKMTKIAYKKWKLEFSESSDDKVIRIEILQSLPQGGTWAPYSLYAYLDLKGVWYDFFQKNGKSQKWVKVLKKKLS